MPWWVWLISTLATGAAVGWAVTKAYATHNWKTCQCVDCRKRRYFAHKRQGHEVSGVTSNGDLIWTKAEEQPAPTRRKIHWVSTAELDARMVVLLRGVPHEIMEIRTDQKGYRVFIQALEGKNRRQPFIVTVAWANGNQRYWEPR
jgi:hypothetical protein